MHIRRSSQQFLGAALPLLLALGLSQTAQAANLFFGQDQNSSTSFAKEAETNFLSGLKQVRTEDFESFLPGTSSPISNPLQLNFGPDSASLIGGGAIRNADFNGLHAISGNKYWSLTFAEAVRNTYTIAFSSEQAALGFYATDMGDSGRNAFSLVFHQANGEKSTVAIPHVLGSADRNKLFFGYIDTQKPFTSVTFIASGPIERDGFGLDDVTIGRVENVVSTPEPGVLLGLLGLGLIAGRKVAAKSY